MRIVMMPMVSGLLRTVGFLLVMAGLTACQSVPRPAAPLYPPPVASDRFALSSPEQKVIGELQVVIAGPNDTLPELARRFNLGYEEIVAANPGVSIESPRGMRVVLPTRFILPNAPRQGIVINLATLRMFYFPPSEAGGPQEVITHPIGIGREGWSTPLGKAQVVRKVAGPTWNVPDSIRREHAAQGDRLPGSVPPGLDNPLGTHALYLSWPRYLIHGTNKPGGIGMRVSHGCIQLYPEDIAPLYEQVKAGGTPVHVVNQPMLAAWHEGMLYLDAHPPLRDDGRNWRKGVRALLKAEAAKRGAGKAGIAAVDWDKVTQLVTKPRGITVPILVGAPPLETVLKNTQVVENSVPVGANYQQEESGIPSVRRAGLSQVSR